MKTAILALAAVVELSAAGSPVYFYLHGQYVDHISYAWSESGLVRAMTTAQRLKQQDPAHFSPVVLYVNGAVAEAVAQRERGTELASRIRQAVSQGLVEIAYDGSDEPCWRLRPRPDLRSAKTPEQRLQARIRTAGWFLSEYKDLLTGQTNPEASGGLRRAQEVFGKATSVVGLHDELGVDTDWVEALASLNSTALMPGFAEGSTWPARTLHGYAGSAQGVCWSLSPDAAMAPEVYFQDNRLRLSIVSGPPVETVFATKGAKALSDVIARLDRSRPHVLHVRLAGSEFPLSPGFYSGLGAVRYACDNPKRALPPPTALRPEAEVEAGLKAESEVLAWLTHDFFPSNPGSRFVSAGQIAAATSNSVGTAFSAGDLKTAVNAFLKAWGDPGYHPPIFAVAGERYLSLADLFYLLASSLAHQDRTGTAPPSVTLRHIYGPLEVTLHTGPDGKKITAKSILTSSRAIAEGWAPEGAIFVPGWVDAGGLHLNAAQFLRLMAKAYLPGKPEGSLDVHVAQMRSETGEQLPTTFHATEMGPAWTIKPAPLKLAKQ